MPVRRPRSDAARNRAAIVAAAREVFAELGPEAPFDAIARRAEVANATLYRHFANMSELRQAIFAERLRETEDVLTTLETEADAGHALAKYLRWIAETPDVSLLDLLNGTGGDGGHAATRARVRGRVTALIERAAAAGAVRADFTIADLDVVILALTRVAIADWVDDARRERFLRTVLRGIS